MYSKVNHNSSLTWNKASSWDSYPDSQPSFTRRCNEVVIYVYLYTTTVFCLEQFYHNDFITDIITISQPIASHILTRWWPISIGTSTNPTDGSPRHGWSFLSLRCRRSVPSKVMPGDGAIGWWFHQGKLVWVCYTSWQKFIYTSS